MLVIALLLSVHMNASKKDGKVLGSVVVDPRMRRIHLAAGFYYFHQALTVHYLGHWPQAQLPVTKAQHSLSTALFVEW